MTSLYRTTSGSDFVKAYRFTYPFLLPPDIWSGSILDVTTNICGSFIDSRGINMYVTAGDWIVFDKEEKGVYAIVPDQLFQKWFKKVADENYNTVSIL